MIEVRAKADGRLRAWIEVDEDVEQRPLNVGEDDCLPVEIGVFETVVFETDREGLHPRSAL